MVTTAKTPTAFSPHLLITGLVLPIRGGLVDHIDIRWIGEAAGEVFLNCYAEQRGQSAAPGPSRDHSSRKAWRR